MSYEFIQTDQVDRVAIITLNRPEVLNALNLGLTRELDQAITNMEEDDGVGAIIITGAGERAFSAGADIHENRERSAEERKETQRERSHYTWHLTTASKPIIGAINGLCYGGGTVMATAMDFLVGCERTSGRSLSMSLRFIFTYHHQVMLSRTEKPGRWKSHPIYKLPGGRPLVIKTSVIAAKDAFTSRGQSQSCLWVGSY
jgi:hypothetical protein